MLVAVTTLILTLAAPQVPDDPATTETPVPTGCRRTGTRTRFLGLVYSTRPLDRSG